MIKVEDLEVVYRNPTVRAVSNVSFEVRRGSTLSIVGPSGSGKTTILHVLAGLTPPTRGRVSIDGGDVCLRRETALIMQDYGLLPWKTVWGNATLGLAIRHYPRRERAKIVSGILEQLGIADLKHKYPSQLSGGERQRVAIARALSTDPDLLLMDEPFSSLDALTREDLQNLTLDIWRRTRLTICVVTHSIEEAALLGRTIVVLSRGEVVETLENPGMGSGEYRYSEDFFSMCNHIRRAMGDVLRRRGKVL
ncbi:MAG: ABC transporter ATP-binding protein [bacterium]